MAYPSEMDSIGLDNPIPREAGKRPKAGPSLGNADAPSALGEGTPIPGYEHGRPVRTRRDELIDASRARRGGRAGATYPSGGCLDRAAQGTHPGRRPAPKQSPYPEG